MTKRELLTRRAQEVKDGKLKQYVICNKCKGRGRISYRIRGQQRVIMSADIGYKPCNRCNGEGVEKAEDMVKQQVNVMKEGEVLARLLAARHDVEQEQVDSITKLLRRFGLNAKSRKKSKKERAKEKREKKRSGGSSNSNT